jgi:molybdate transport system ATP-binding protein
VTVRGLDAKVAVTIGSFELSVELAVAPGEVLAILGPNGSGKTTLLRCLAGLQPIDRGQIALNATVLDEPLAATFVVPERRSVGVVFQDYLLFAHLSALDNVAFGLQARGIGRREARPLAGDWLDRVGLAEFHPRRPAQLSGGQQQRVALARALATRPDLLLLDEPLAALDAATRADVRRDLRAHLSEFEGVTILVTHDPLDAYALADRVVVLEAGGITQAGRLAEIAAKPRSRYVAQLAGTNLLQGAIEGSTLTTTNGAALTVDTEIEGPAYAVISPTAVALFSTRPDGSPRNVWSTTIDGIDLAFDRARVTLASPHPLVVELTTAGLAALGRHVGDEVWASARATEIVTYPA